MHGLGTPTYPKRFIEHALYGEAPQFLIAFPCAQRLRHRASGRAARLLGSLAIPARAGPCDGCGRAGVAGRLRGQARLAARSARHSSRRFVATAHHLQALRSGCGRRGEGHASTVDKSMHDSYSQDATHSATGHNKCWQVVRRFAGQVMDAWLAAFAAAATKCTCSQILVTYACPAAISAAAGDVGSRRVSNCVMSSRFHILPHCLCKLTHDGFLPCLAWTRTDGDVWHGGQVACAMLGALASSMAAQDVDLLLLRRALLLCQDTDSGVRQVIQVRQHS